MELRSDDGAKLALDVALQYKIIHIPDNPDLGPYKVKTLGYMHTVQTQDDAEVLAFHWHPSGSSHNVDPHLHVGSSQLSEDGVLSKKTHIPTGRISVEEVLRFCIKEFGVEPLRDDWEQILADGEDLFRMWRTWASSPTPVSTPPQRSTESR